MLAVPLVNRVHNNCRARGNSGQRHGVSRGRCPPASSMGVFQSCRTHRDVVLVRLRQRRHFVPSDRVCTTVSLSEQSGRRRDAELEVVRRLGQHRQAEQRPEPLDVLLVLELRRQRRSLLGELRHQRFAQRVLDAFLEALLAVIFLGEGDVTVL